MVRVEQQDVEEASVPPLERLPDGTERVVLLHRYLQVWSTNEVLSDWDGLEDLPDEKMIIRFEAGDELPLKHAGTCWPAFNDRFAAFDGENKRLDEPADTEHRMAVSYQS